MDLNTAIEKGISMGEARGISMGKQEGISIGEARGISMGKQEGIKNMALKMLEDGDPIKKIARITELSEQEILQLKK
ncbi:MAG: hypothetical protein LBS83_00900 [Holosporales bacterium]|jgi:predicted transposase/invertase (TIGR01784 family)|nr:hypothetical protein [Holosporales bacterium]